MQNLLSPAPPHSFSREEELQTYGPEMLQSPSRLGLSGHIQPFPAPTRLSSDICTHIPSCLPPMPDGNAPSSFQSAAWVPCDPG